VAVALGGSATAVMRGRLKDENTEMRRIYFIVERVTGSAARKCIY
jgi:hypothetical protein